MANLYVRTPGNGGNDANPGSNAQPFATVSAAQAAAANGDVIRIGPGTYAENTGAAGFFNVNRAFGSLVTFQSEYDKPEGVTIQGSSAASFNTLTNAANGNYKFRSLTFGFWVNTTASAFRITQTTGISFENCVFLTPTDNAAARYALWVQPSGATAVAGVVCDTCQAVGGTNTNGNGFFFDKGAGTSVAGPQMLNCIASAVVSALSFSGDMAGIDVQGGTYVGLGGYGIRVGVDGTSATVLTGSIKNVDLIDTSAGTGHALLVGGGATNFLVEGLKDVRGADYGVVIKENSGTILRYCRLLMGGFVSAVNKSAVYLKAANGASVTFNRMAGYGGTTGVLRMGPGDTANTFGTNTVTDNSISAYGSTSPSTGVFTPGRCLQIPTTGDGGGNVVDRNWYRPRFGSYLGDVRASVNIQTIQDLRAAWAGYGAGTNDQNSRRGPGRLAA